ncbi:hypothetical protein V490_02966 [Pseudogymnoascus sp. VKM F-3557]|nr:hypothetical protein V490_02966 [Pseudogymnoascus sp. VKM F-3557]
MTTTASSQSDDSVLNIPGKPTGTADSSLEERSNSNTIEVQKHERGLRFWSIIIGLGFTSLLVALENTVVSTSLPTIVEDLHIGQGYVWMINIFFLTSAAFQPLFGQLANIFGRRWVTLFIVATFTLGSGICGGANSAAMLIAGRGVQGIGSGGINMIVEVIISDLVPLRQRGNYMAIILSIYSVGVSLGPFVGGIIVQTTSWRWVFYINLPVGGAALVVLYLALHVNYNKEMTFFQKLRRIDFVGNMILILSSLSVLFALTDGGSKYDWNTYNIIVPLVLGLLGFIVFPFYEASKFCVDPVMPNRLFNSRTSVVIAICTFVNSIILYWVVYFLPVYFQAVLGSTPARAGVQVIPMTVIGIPGAAISVVVLAKWGKYRILHQIGFGIMTIGLGLFTLQNRHTTTAEWVIYQVIPALGSGMVLNTMLPAFQAGLKESDQAAATATWAFIRSLGFIWGVAIPAAVFNNRFENLSYRINDVATRELLSHGHAYQYGSRDFVNSFAEPLKGQIIGVYSDSLRVVWFVALGVSAIPFLLSFGEEQIKLRKELDTEYGLEEKSVEKRVALKQVEKGESAGDEKNGPATTVSISQTTVALGDVGGTVATRNVRVIYDEEFRFNSADRKAFRKIIRLIFTMLLYALVLECLILSSNAGAGANVNGCVYYAVQPSRPFKVTFDVPTSVVHCMYDKGSSATAEVVNYGLTCASVGHVSGKSSSSGGDLCATDDSRWGMNYTAGPKSGTTYSTWHAPVFGSDHIDLYGQDSSTNICGSESKCYGASIKVSSSGESTVWIIFDPLSNIFDPLSDIIDPFSDDGEGLKDDRLDVPT